ncbi:unnamed protein product [Heterosigma akashiwo]|uniref:Uncharacterized protein n=1 Tax=Heterosigma akashiwo TaxID=2829 RepID=A0A6S9EH52_HETAK|mmetsp:Transcript_14278/g.19690  ORF Transcript_14278/g.19690 Transcript_14278/m.19690 type:complete len:190 (-) Transcript_14278:201-770(-)|eukprot:CAMPEP_0194575400 /NCGR_PEP_ID=MMETSP0292-20121207/10894_1 /TAXON_ID=39354 /ORGANISM="Heterosigma akashiwo, Strain CCMP2393" /LENGTH=189 /DNA_ID=CAMNT_0039427169 /DNA_START=32 /DNA_END=601 /DNA_ORIENTATION=-
MADLDLDSMLEETELAPPPPPERTLDDMLDDIADEVFDKPAKSKHGKKKRTAAATLHGALACLPPAMKEEWMATIQADTRVQMELPRQEVLSRAYRAFFSREQKELLQREGDDEHQLNVGNEILKETFQKALAKFPQAQNVNVPSGEVMKKMQALYLRQVAREAKPRMQNSSDYDPEKFPNANTKIMCA